MGTTIPSRAASLPTPASPHPNFSRGVAPARPVGGVLAEALVFPGVLLVEAIAQAAGVVAMTANPDMRQQLVYLTGLDGFRFRRPIIPGDQVRITVEKLAEKWAIWKFTAKAEVSGVHVAEGEVMATVIGGERTG